MPIVVNPIADVVDRRRAGCQLTGRAVSRGTTDTRRLLVETGSNAGVFSFSAFLRWLF